VKQQKKILIIGGGKWQVPIVQKAKELGCYVINSNLYENSNAFEFADIGLVADVLDKEKNLEIAKAYHVDAVITDQSDIAVNAVAYVAEQLSLTGVGSDMAGLFTNKFRMRTELRVQNLHHPKFKLCRNLNEATSFFQELSAEVIVKPLNSQSSRGVVRVKRLEELKNAMLTALSQSKDGSFLIEEFIGGIELTVEGFKPLDEQHVSLAISKKTHFDNTCIADSLLYLNRFEDFDSDQLKRINNALFERLAFGITHVEYKYFNGKFYLVEAAIRGGGTKISSHIIPAVSGVDVNELLIRTVLTGSTPRFKVRLQQCAVLKFFRFPEGEIKSISGLEIKNQPSILELELEFSVGDCLAPPTDDRSRAGYYIAVAKSEEELLTLIERVDNTVKVEI